MIAVAEAQQIVLAHARPLTPEVAPLATCTLGMVMAEDVTADLDMPPFDKSLMDGYAVRSADAASGQATLKVVEEITAGQTPTLTVGPGQAARIMTGAAVPAGADAVVMSERTQPAGNEHVRLDDGPPRPGQNIMRRGAEMRAGDVVVSTGALLRPQEFGVLATVGRTAVKVHPRPTMALVSTGDEIVEAFQTPGPGQIRNGNGPMLMAQAVRAGALPRYLGNARDREESLRPLIADGLKASVLVLCGGVSAGKLDLVPGILQEMGVRPHFHKIAMKPGKPLFFGTHGETLVFGLPGNPVSSYVCFELFVRPAVRRLMGLADPGPRTREAVLVEAFAHRSDRPTYQPARLEYRNSGYEVSPVPWLGSPDLRGVAAAQAFMILPAGEHQFQPGQRLQVLLVEY